MSDTELEVIGPFINIETNSRMWINVRDISAFSSGSGYVTIHVRKDSIGPVISPMYIIECSTEKWARALKKALGVAPKREWQDEPL